MKLWQTFVLSVLVASIGSTLALAESSGEPQQTLLFDSGKEGYRRYRIPALIVSPRGDLLAFCEGRKDGGGLNGNIDIVVKRSPDQGRSWQPLEVVADDGPNTLGNPCPVIDRRDGTIWLPFTRSLGEDTEDEIVKRTSKERTRVMITKSTDDGHTWSKPIEITQSTKRPEWTWYGTGPGVGVQLASGRLLIPSYHTDGDTEIYRSHAIYSDDAGKTWKLGGTVGDHTSECHVAQRKDGTLYLNTRTVIGTELRTIATSTDGGESWSKAMFDEGLYDPHCQASLLSLDGATPDGKSRWLYSGPAGPGRSNMTVRVSYDQGRTWPVAKRINRGDSQYSSLALLPDQSIACFYESWQTGNVRIHVARLTLDWLTDGQDSLEK